MQQDKLQRLQRLGEFFRNQSTAGRFIFVVAAFLSVTPVVTPPIALALGLFATQWRREGTPSTSHLTTFILQISVVGLGFGMNLTTALETGRAGLLFTIISLTGTLVAGFFFGKLLKTSRKTSYLISAGTAICGGSAIATVSPIIKAKHQDTSVAFGTVFILNAAALFIFPLIGKLFHLSETQFGVWCAVAIHDTSSVVGAAARYGAHAVEVATTLKLTRALWIIPLALLSALVFKNKEKKFKAPYFIGGFVIAMTLNTYVPIMHGLGKNVSMLSHAGLKLALFFVGYEFQKSALKTIGARPLLQGLFLWIVVSTVTLLVILNLGYQ